MPEKPVTDPILPTLTAPIAPDATEIPFTSIGDLAQKLYDDTPPNRVNQAKARLSDNEPILILIARGPIQCSVVEQAIKEVYKALGRLAKGKKL